MSELQLFPSPEDTLSGTAEAIRTGRTTCVAAIERCLERIAHWEPRVRAWVSVDREGALARAEELDALLAAGTWLGPLHGIPLGIKDIIDVAGWPTGAGFPPFAGKVAATDAPLVTRLRNAGAILLGKTVTTQFAGFDPPVTRNPWNLERTPGGSSSGSAAAVATGMCLGAMGSQTGGSITRPASFCGVAGCKPSHGRLNAEGFVPISPQLDHPGPLARTVADAAAMYAALASEKPPAAFPDLLRPTGPRPVVLGRLRGFFEERATPAVTAATDAALERLAATGAEVREVALPASFGTMHAQHRLLMAVDGAEWHEKLYAQSGREYLPCIRALLDEGLAARAIDYARAREHQLQLRREFEEAFAGVDALVCPATASPAPDVATTGDPAFNAPWSYTGLPVVSFPISLSPDGLPLALQVVGRRMEEGELFRTAAWCEGHVG